MKRRIYKTNIEALRVLDNENEKIIPVYGGKWLKFEIVYKKDRSPKERAKAIFDKFNKGA